MEAVTSLPSRVKGPLRTRYLLLSTLIRRYDQVCIAVMALAVTILTAKGAAFHHLVVRLHQVKEEFGMTLYIHTK